MLLKIDFLWNFAYEFLMQSLHFLLLINSADSNKKLQAKKMQIHLKLFSQVEFTATRAHWNPQSINQINNFFKHFCTNTEQHQTN